MAVDPDAPGASPPTVRVLALDGGGILCVLALHILTFIERLTGKPICDLFQVISGVSSGGLVALALTTPVPSAGRDLSKCAVPGAPQNSSELDLPDLIPSIHRRPAHSASALLALCQAYGPLLFHKTWPGRLLSWVPLGGLLYRLHRCMYDPAMSAFFFGQIFGQTRLSQALCPLLIPTYNLTPGPGKEPHMKLFVWPKVARKGVDVFMSGLAQATCAVPTFFPPHPLETLAQSGQTCRRYTLIDGGVGMNSPALAAYTYARRLYPQASIRVLCVGTSRDFQGYPSVIKARAPGLVSWYRKVQDLIVQPTTSASHYVLKHLGKDPQSRLSVLRLQPELNQVLGDFDDASARHLDAIAQVSHILIQRYAGQIKQFFQP